MTTINPSWQGLAAYTAPAGNSADFSFGQGTSAGASAAAGFSSTVFGSGVVAHRGNAAGFSGTQFGQGAVVNTGAAAGFSSTVFGLGLVASRGSAAGFSGTQFGQGLAIGGSEVPRAAGFQAVTYGTHTGTSRLTGSAAGFSVGRVGVAQASATVGVTRAQASGFVPTHFGVPARVNGVAESLGIVTKFSQAYFSFPQWSVAEAPYAPVGADFGLPAYVPPAPPLRRDGWAQGFKATTPGQPEGRPSTSARAVGWEVTQLGLPASGNTHAAAGFAVGAVGAPAASSRVRGAGLRLTAFGRPAVAQAFLASPVPRSAVCGVPRSDILGTRKARGFATTRWARPSCRTGIFRLATSLAPQAKFGAAEAHSTFRVRHIAPIVRYGRDILRRNTTC